MVVKNSKAIVLREIHRTNGASRPDSAGTVHAIGERLPDRSPKFFDLWQYRTVCALCEAIIPPDEDCGGAAEAGAPEFIDLLASENKQIAIKLSLGLQCVDEVCISCYGARYLECMALQQTEILEAMAYRENAERNETLKPGIEGFALLRRLTLGAFFTSRIGMDYLNYVGNTHLGEFPGCSVPADWPRSLVAQPRKNGGENG